MCCGNICWTCRAGVSRCRRSSTRRTRAPSISWNARTDCARRGELRDGDIADHRASAQLRLSLVKLFLDRFTLTPAEESALTSRDHDVGQELFAALDRVETIRRDCQALLGGDESRMQAG